MEIGLKWVYMARYELILRLDGALWLPIILKPLLTPKRAMESSKINKKVKNILEQAKCCPWYNYTEATSESVWHRRRSRSKNLVFNECRTSTVTSSYG